MGYILTGIDGYNFKRKTRSDVNEDATQKRRRLELAKQRSQSPLYRLPEEVLDIIFVMTGPYNALAQTSRYFHNLFHYEHSSTPPLICQKNLSLVMSMSRAWYTFDANYSLDLEKLAKKFTRYRTYIDRSESRRAKAILSDLGAYIVLFIRNSSVLVDSVFAQKFMTLEVYKKVFMKMLRDANRTAETFISKINSTMASYITQTAIEHPLFLSPRELVQESQRRYQFIELVFKHLAMLLDSTTEDLTMEAISEFKEPKKLAIDFKADTTFTDERLSMLAEVLPQSAGSLREYPDELVAVLEQNKLTYMNLGGSSRALPEPMFWKGLADARRRELLIPLVASGCEVDQTRLMLATIESYTNSTISFPLADALQELYKLDVAEPLAAVPLIELCHQYPDNDQYTEALVKTLEWVYSTSQGPDEDNTLWNVVGRLKDRRLAEILFRFDDRPSSDILGIF
ncbi:hypothetical protein DIURU_005657 [Diutina rugosa]|uniref:F-box domain-containing protein n=1 Tax=Diutina rugosa TaxID=5481 RepID=A0A642UCC1_DIURU|nr:uncharacterized protein DIURU_005657 [Diutina rugosa]KAA8896645.1 hypothetical protein DIURU_005657 [Diutina rugosa]